MNSITAAAQSARRRPDRTPVYPLSEFYLEAEQPLPAIELIGADAVPEPYKSLLVHERDMTSTLEEFHGAGVRLYPLRTFTRGDAYFREVVLRLEGNGRPVEFGAIKIHLAGFSPTARRLILGAYRPLGRILKDCEVPYLSRPKTFLRVTSDGLINRALGLDGPHRLYGRRNTLSDPAGRPLAEIVEILPP
jgi:chorismate-pyruvate lyase